jgi:hypothetical protein
MSVLFLIITLLQPKLKGVFKGALLHRGWWRNINKWSPVIGVPIGCALGIWLVIKIQEWVTLYQIEPIVAFVGLNVLGIALVYLGIKAKNWANYHARDITEPIAVAKPPTSVNMIAHTRLPSKNFNHVTPANSQKPKYPSHVQTIMAIPRGISIQPASLTRAPINIYLFLRKLFHKKGIA